MDPKEIDSPVSAFDEKDIEKGEADSELEREESGHLEPIRSAPRTSPYPKPRSLHSTRSRRSFGGEDGYSVRDDENLVDGLPAGYEEPPETAEQKEFEVGWDGESDPMNPRCSELWHKWLIVIVIAFCSLCVYVGITSQADTLMLTKLRSTCTSSLYTLTYEQLERDFHTSREISTLGLSLYVIGLGFGPMVSLT